MTAPRPEDLPGDVARLRASFNVLFKDFEDLRRVVREAAERADVAATSARAATASVDELSLTLREFIESVGGRLDAIDETLTTMQGDEDEEVAKKPEPDWITTRDPGAAATILADLADWIGAVWSRYPNSRLTDCWSWHPAVVSELVACRRMWLSAYRLRGASAARVADWLDRWRPGTASRIRAELKGCSLAEHVPGGRRTAFPPRLAGNLQLDEVAAWWATTAGAAPGPQPSPLSLDAEGTRVEDDIE